MRRVRSNGDGGSAVAELAAVSASSPEDADEWRPPADRGAGGGDLLYLAAVVFSDKSMGYSCSTATPPGAGLDSRRSPPAATTVLPAATAACQLAAAMDSDRPPPTNGVSPGRVTDSG